MTAHRAKAGSDVIRQGEPGDTFYIVVSGRLAALIDGTVVGELGPADSFGEIALLRATERTATVRAIEDSDLAHAGPRAVPRGGIQYWRQRRGGRGGGPNPHRRHLTSARVDVVRCG